MYAKKWWTCIFEFSKAVWRRHIYIFTICTKPKGFPWWLSWERICLQCGRPGFNPWVGKSPWRRESLLTPVFWLGELYGLYGMGSQRVGHNWAIFTSFKTKPENCIFSYCILNYYQILNMSPCYCLVAKSCLFATPWTVACQAPLSMGFPRQENWSGFPVLLQGIFPTQGLNLRLLLGRQILYDWATWEAPLGNCFRDRIHVLFQVWVAGECNQMNPRRRDCRGGLGRVVEVCSWERVGLGCVCC